MCNSVGKTPQRALSSRVPLGGQAGKPVGFMSGFNGLPAQAGFNSTVGHIANDRLGWSVTV